MRQLAGCRWNHRDGGAADRAGGSPVLLRAAATGCARLPLHRDAEDATPSGASTFTSWWDREFGDLGTTGGLRLIGKDLDGDRRVTLVLSHGSGSKVTTIRGSLVVPQSSYVFWPGQSDLIP